MRSQTRHAHPPSRSGIAKDDATNTTPCAHIACGGHDGEPGCHTRDPHTDAGPLPLPPLFPFPNKTCAERHTPSDTTPHDGIGRGRRGRMCARRAVRRSRTVARHLGAAYVRPRPAARESGRPRRLPLRRVRGVWRVACNVRVLVRSCRQLRATLRHRIAGRARTADDTGHESCPTGSVAARCHDGPAAATRSATLTAPAEGTRRAGWTRRSTTTAGRPASRAAGSDAGPSRRRIRRPAPGARRRAVCVAHVAVRRVGSF